MLLTSLISNAAQQSPHKIFSKLPSESDISFSTSWKRIQQLGSFLRLNARLNLQGRVGILSLNSYYYLEAMFAISYAGGVFLPLNYRLSISELNGIIEHSNMECLFVDKEFSESLVGKLNLKANTTLMFMGTEKEIPETLRQLKFPLHSVVSLYDDDKKSLLPDAELSGNDVAALYYTGGTTGKPKGVMLTIGNIFVNALGISSRLRFDETSIYLHVAPMFHLADAQMVYAALMNQSRQIFLPKFSPNDTLIEIQNHKITHTVLVPVLLQFCLSLPNVTEFDLSSLQVLVYGASMMSETLLDQAMKLLPSASFFQGYGMTECSPGISMLDAKYHTKAFNSKLKTIGKPYPWCEVKIVDENDQEVQRGMVGEIIVRGPNVMKGYWNDLESTEKVMRNGWMHTGDGGFMDEDGFLTLKDRIKDMIKTGGENVFSNEVEQVLSGLEGVAMVAVIGTPSDEYGELVTAVIVPKNDFAKEKLSDLEYVRGFCKNVIAGYKCPRKVVLKSSLPVSGAGKILKHKLREEFWTDQPNHIYSDGSKKSKYT